MVGSYWMGGNRREGEGREVVGSYWMGGNRREGEGRGRLIVLTQALVYTAKHSIHQHLQLHS